MPKLTSALPPKPSKENIWWSVDISRTKAASGQISIPMQKLPFSEWRRMELRAGALGQSMVLPAISEFSRVKDIQSAMEFHTQVNQVKYDKKTSMSIASMIP